MPTHETRKYVDALASFGVPQDKIADVLEIDEKTLRKHYAPQLATAAVKANALVAQSLFNKATKGEGQPAVTAAIFWMKTRGGWRETTVNEHIGKNGGPIQTQDVPPTDWSKVPKADRQAVREVLERHAAATRAEG